MLFLTPTYPTVVLFGYSTIQRIIILQKKVIRIINLQPRNFHTSPLFKQNSILKFQDKICLENILFVRKSLNNLSPYLFPHRVISFIKLFYETKRYGKYSITVSDVESWKKIQKQLKGVLLKQLSPNEIKTIVSDFYLKSY